MNIDFQTITGNKMSQSQSTAGMESRNGIRPYTGKADPAGDSVFVATLDSSLFSNDAYAKHTRTAESISEMAQNTDVWTQHNYMALLSNTMSEEDYAKAAEDGFDIKNIDSSETVTILDNIKSVLLESGTKITGFNDDLSIDKLAKITGSRSFANAIVDNFEKNDLPVTTESARQAKVAYEEVSDIQQLDDNAVKYLVQNNMSPTIENIYLASHSTNGQNISGRGFYAQETGGYYAQKADTYEWDQLDPQIDKVMEEAHLSGEEVRDQARWIVLQGIPLTKESLISLHEIKEIEFPVSEEVGAEAIAAAIADNKKATDANLYDRESSFNKAFEIKESAKNISDEAIRATVSSGEELNIRNLASQTDLSILADANDPKVVEARLQLEEVRLRMTVEANRQLLLSGFSIDTAPMTELIERLKGVLGNMADESAGAAVDEITGVTPQNKNFIISATISRVSFISEGPIDVSGAMADKLESASLVEISETSKKIQLRYKQAGEEYESLMTKPRSDLGDNIKKAFRNVDDILDDLNIEKTEDNRRAIRILGYNSMEISEENFEKVRSWDQMLKTTLERLKPGAVLDLVRAGKNPLGMTIEELAGSLDSSMTKDGDSSEGQNAKSKADEKYSKFLYKLDHAKEITESERESFIGIYRLFHTLKAQDYQAIGSVLKTDREMTIGNLLQAVRTTGRSKSVMDYTIDDSFGGLETKNTGSSALKIDEQIQMAFRFYSSKADIVYENLEPEKLMSAKPNKSTLLDELANELENAGTDDALDKDYYAQQIRHIREVISGKESDAAFGEIKALELETTFNNLEAMISNRRSRRREGIWDKADGITKEGFEKEQKMLVDALEEDDYGSVYKSTLEAISDKMQEVLENESDTYLDVRAISLMQKQLSVMSLSSERGFFDVPVEIGGQKISMHITLKSDNSMDSRMEASIQTYEFGLITATLYKKNDIITGMLTTTNGQSSEEVEYLESVRSKMCVKLAEKLKDVGVGQESIAILYHTQTQPTSVGQANANATDGNSKNITETKDLLTMAKAFIEAL
ncbi:MAG: hypothetical protein IKO76_00475 [Butyrivibrio sp.]|nr:hypothetical protein [Butyrivibrio sp.]